MTCDLDELERVVAEMKPGPAFIDRRDPWRVVLGDPDPDEGRSFGRFIWQQDAIGIVALRNAAPALIARVRELEAVIRRILDTEHGSGAEHDAMCDARALIAHDLKPIDKEADRG